jgi:hypothetical protein
MGTIAVKNVDARLFRRVKALASLEGKTMGEEVNEALAMWLAQRNISPDLLEKWEALERESTMNQKAFEEMRARLLSEHPGEFAVISRGKLSGVFKQESDALRRASEAGATQTIVTQLVEKKPRVVELGLSIYGELIS